MGLGLVDPIFGDDCTLCFPVGRTPKYLLASFSGILAGDLWEEWMPPPPNGTIRLTQTIQLCRWQGTSGSYGAEYHTYADYSSLSAGVPFPFPVCFGSFASNQCVYSFASGIISPVNEYYWSGRGQISWI